MKLTLIEFENFRLLQQASVSLDSKGLTTILVGPNNSGKTSVAEGLDLFVQRGSFAIDDFSLGCRSAFACLGGVDMVHGSSGADAPTATVAASEEPTADSVEPSTEVGAGDQSLPQLPRMSLLLEFAYDDSAEDLAAIGDLITNLEATHQRIRIRIAYEVKDAAALMKAYAEWRSSAPADRGVLSYLRPRLSQHYERRYYKVDPDSNEELVLKNFSTAPLMRVDFIRAQRHLDDAESGRATRLSKALQTYYERWFKTAAPGPGDLPKTLESHSRDLTGHYATVFSNLFDDLSRFGFPPGRSPQLSVRAELEAESLFRDSTRVYYRSETQEPSAEAPDENPRDETTDRYLPEKYNGLGFKNLIYLVLQMAGFREEARNASPLPRTHLILLEEPEAHLHPQIQTVFVSELSRFLTKDTGSLTTQVLLTTHSPHVAAESGFTPIRYFRRVGATVDVRDLCTFDSSQTTPDARAAIDFLRKYLWHTRCDLLFADKAIFVEGPVERLLLPTMLSALAATPGSPLRSQYVSIVEVGGAHAHLFAPLIAFLGIPALVIADIDSVGVDGKRCTVADGVATSNATLRLWLPKLTTIADLNAATEGAKVAGAVRVAYQVPENETAPCGRSFEEAFIYRNAAWLVTHAKALRSGTVATHLTADALMAAAFDLKVGKVDFALDLLATSGWATPRYIEDGLAWLARVSA